MATSVLTHDLKTVRKIVLRRLRPRDAKVYLFGSHATGKARRHSDIDIAILPLRPLPPTILTEIREQLEESDVVRNVDVIDLSETDESFRRRVQKEGIPWKEKERLQVARKALKTLRELTDKPKLTEVERDAAIQRFEYTFEAVWKTAQLYLSDIEGLTANSPKSAVRASWQVGLFNEKTAQTALRMAEARNLTVHTYNEKLAQSVYRQIKGYVDVFEVWLGNMQRKMED